MSTPAISPRTAALRYNVSMWTIYDWIRKGKIPTRKIPSGRLRIFPEDSPCRPPAAWDHLGALSARSMGPPQRQ
ncbi:MAG: hypothetical protein IPM45_04010 [Acidimicrobiales bacterium]|nr:hypothetical protein [Acidimicrobiales bacterium]